MEGTVLKGRWRIAKKVGQGAFGEIYSGSDLTTQDPIAVKLERWDNKKAVLKMEVAVLKKLQNCPFACKYVHCGHFEDHNYLIMELLGENLSELRRRRLGGRFSLATTVRLGMQMVRAVEAIHELGYLHRDIKPSNFAMGLQPGRKEQCVMIDFGLTRKYRLPNGQIRPPREIAGFRGTARYASINSHLSKELSRCDDLWSVLYLLIEFLTGQLPWRKLKDKEEIGLLKIHFNSPELVRDLPTPYLTFMQHLQSLDYLDRPDYDMLVQLLEDLGGGVAMTTPYDWELSGGNNQIPSSQNLGRKNSNQSEQYSSHASRVHSVVQQGADMSTNNENVSIMEDQERLSKLLSTEGDQSKHTNLLESSIGATNSVPRLGTPATAGGRRKDGGMNKPGMQRQNSRERRQERRANQEKGPDSSNQESPTRLAADLPQKAEPETPENKNSSPTSPPPAASAGANGRANINSKPNSASTSTTVEHAANRGAHPAAVQHTESFPAPREPDSGTGPGHNAPLIGGPQTVPLPPATPPTSGNVTPMASNVTPMANKRQESQESAGGAGKAFEGGLTAVSLGGKTDMGPPSPRGKSCQCGGGCVIS